MSWSYLEQIDQQGECVWLAGLGYATVTTFRGQWLKTTKAYFSSVLGALHMAAGAGGRRLCSSGSFMGTRVPEQATSCVSLVVIPEGGERSEGSHAGLGVLAQEEHKSLPFTVHCPELRKWTPKT